ncbi:juvenile hormone esterase-like [Athalia rosae]|uniref:juvenile hormone esterase-like n=1 Tax=Athalia rosae TaxID=37344 RepID=UPI0020339CBD|nr:juvenile hormone esterase-like [Athalia rosae]
MGSLAVLVKQGWLRGTLVKSVIGDSYISFKGIPFAAPPVGKLRFADPQPPQSWEGIREAMQEEPKCPQFDPFLKKIVGDEDCLYLNVASKSLEGSRPVMVWIHGGAFILGSSSYEIYSPDYLMKADIVFVSINYRVGPFGFFQLDHPAAPGNVGLKDQIAALKWVKENIARFGGDPNNVTIFGESAGGASVHYLLLSPLARGLFHKAILQSGVAFNPWASAPSPVETAHRFVAALGKETTDPREIVDYLRTIPASKLVEAQTTIHTVEEKLQLTFPFHPNVDDKSQEPVIPRPVRELAKEAADVPTIIGYNSHEGMVFLFDLTDETLALVDKNFEKTLPPHMVAEAPSRLLELANEFRRFHFGDLEVSQDTLDSYIQCYGNMQFVQGIHEVVEMDRTRKKSPTYLYKFTFDSPKSLQKFLRKDERKGTAHADDLPYIFYASRGGLTGKHEIGSAEKIVSDRFVRMWTDFARTGNPTPEIDDLITVRWEPVTKEKKHYLEIDADLSTGVNPDEKLCEFSNRVSQIVDDAER